MGSIGARLEEGRRGLGQDFKSAREEKFPSGRRGQWAPWEHRDCGYLLSQTDIFFFL